MKGFVETESEEAKRYACVLRHKQGWNYKELMGRGLKRKRTKGMIGNRKKKNFGYVMN